MMQKPFEKLILFFYLLSVAVLSGCGGGGGSTATAPIPPASGTIATLTASANGSYKESTNIDFTATFTEAVTVSGTPRIILSVGGTAKYANYLSGSGTTVLIFRYAVDSGANDTDGILVGGIQMNSGTILNVAGGLVDLVFLPPNGAAILVDTTLPTVQSATGPANATYIPGQIFNFPLTFNELVNVTGTPRLTLTIGSTTRYANYLSGTGTSVINFRYTVQTGDSDLNGIAIATSIDLNGGSLLDTATNAAVLNFTPPNTASVNVTECPTGYVFVAALSPYTTSPFCVAKYEMKNVGGVATSQATLTPWVSINRASSITACTNLGAAYTLISNAHWQTVARNLEGIGFNWANATVGDAGGMSPGHSDGGPGGPIAAVADDNDSCAGTGQTCDLTTWNSQRRVHRLASGSYLWDFAGNAVEWVSDNNTTNFGADAYVSVITAVNHPNTGTIGGVLNNANYHFGPAGDYTALSAPPYGGLGHGSLNFSAGAMFRGGDYGGNAFTGVFSTNNSNGPTTTAPNIGFRCVWTP